MKQIQKMNNTIIGGRPCAIYADDTPRYLLIQPVDKREAETLDKEIMKLFGTADGLLSEDTVKNAVMPVLK